MQLTRLLPVSLTLAALALVACDDGDIVQPTAREGFATLQIVNAVPTVDTIGLHLDGAQFPIQFARARNTSGVTAANACVNFEAGQHTVAVHELRQSTALATTEYDFEGDERYTLVFSGPEASPEITVLEDNFTPPDTSQHILVRFINASSTPGDVYATPANAPLTGIEPTIANLAPVGGPTADLPWTTIPKTNTQVRFFAPGMTTSPRATLTLTGLPPNRVTNVVFFDPPPPTGVTALRFNACS